MLSYAFHALKKEGIKDVAGEPFANAAELCAAILSKGMSIQIKRGLKMDYVAKVDAMFAIRGKIDFSETARRRSLLRKSVICKYDDWSVNSYPNRIIKSTMLLLLKSDIANIWKKKLRDSLVFLHDVDHIELFQINWHQKYNKNDQVCQMLIGICYLIVHDMLQTTSHGKLRLMNFSEKTMSRLFEKFILEYYRREWIEIHAESPHIKWALDDENYDMLPVMKSDIVLTRGIRTLIIDAKYYSHITQKSFDVNTLVSHNLYQIFSYVKNEQANCNRNNLKRSVSGLLLYAKTDDVIQPDKTYQMSGNQISVKTLDLNCDFSEISKQLDKLSETLF